MLEFVKYVQDTSYEFFNGTLGIFVWLQILGTVRKRERSFLGSRLHSVSNDSSKEYMSFKWKKLNVAYSLSPGLLPIPLDVTSISAKKYYDECFASPSCVSDSVPPLLLPLKEMITICPIWFIWGKTWWANEAPMFCKLQRAWKTVECHNEGNNKVTIFDRNNF